MIETIYTLQAVDLLFIAVVVALVQMVKGFNLPSRFAPLAAILFGIALEALHGGASIAHIVIVGLIVGLSAAGLYSGSKATTTPSITG